MIIFALVALVAGVPLIPIYLLGRGVYARAQEYFVASEDTPPGVVQNSSIAYSLQIATVGQFFNWGANGEFWPAIVFSAMFGAGLYLMYRLRAPMLTFISQALDRDRSVTVPGFIAPPRQ
jgi:Na+/H+-dicarboxylate symporter